LIARVSAIFLLPVFEISSIFSDFQAIAQSTSAREGGNTLCSNAMVRNRTIDGNTTTIRLRYSMGDQIWQKASKRQHAVSAPSGVMRQRTLSFRLILIQRKAF